MRFSSKLFYPVGPNALNSFSYEKFLGLFPSKINLAFAYGSGIFAQKGNEDTHEKMLDFIFTVENSFEWHKANLEMNPNHYALMGKLANNESFHSWLDKTGAGVHFNTGISCQGRKLKYGVISQENLLKDLNNWNQLYVAGRLHKPVHIISHNFEESVDILNALKFNLESGVIASFLLLPESFSELQLFTEIAGLSYTGDIRMGIAEDKSKVSNIVEANMNGFRSLYTPIINSFIDPEKKNFRKDFLYWNKNSNLFIQDKSASVVHGLLRKLPKNLLLEMCFAYDKEAKHIRDIEEIAKGMAKYPDMADLTRKALNSIISQSSTTQTLKNLTTVGPLEAVKYSGQKFSKMLKSLVN